MELGFYIFLFVSGFVTGVFSGLLGIGGALIIIPILLYVPEMIGLKAIPMHMATGISSMQATFGALASSVFHSKNGNVRYDIVINVGIGIAVGSLSGAILSVYLSEIVLLFIYAFFMAFAAVLLFSKIKKKIDSEDEDKSKISRFKGILFGLIIGLPSGALGFAGLVVVIPLLNSIFGVPLRICISSGTHIAFIASLMSFLGKLFTGQINILHALVISVSATIGAFVGTYLNKKANPVVLRYLLLSLVLLALFRVVYDIAEAFNLV